MVLIINIHYNKTQKGESMNKKITALIMSILLVMTSAVPAAASVEDVSSAEVLAETALEEGLPTEEETVLEEEKTVEAGEKTNPETEETAPAAEETAPAAEETVPAAEEAVLAAEETVPETEEAVPAAEETVPATEEIALETEETVPAAEETAQAEEVIETAETAVNVGTSSFSPKDPEDGKIYFIHCSKNTNYVIDIPGASYNNSQAANLYVYNKTAAQKYVFFRNSDGTFRMMNVSSGKMLDAKGGRTSNGTVIQQYEGNNSAAQNWRLVKNANGSYSIQSTVNRSQVIDISGGKMENKRKVQLYRSNGTPAQQFYFEETTDTDLSGEIMMRPLDAELTAAAPKGNSSGNTNLQSVRADGGSAYQWFILKKIDHNLYTIINKASGKAVDISGGRKSFGTNVQLYTPNGTNAQKWRAVRNSNGTYTFYSFLKSDLTLTVKGTSEGSNFYVDARGLNNKQRFYVGNKSAPKAASSTSATAPTSSSVWIESALNSDRVLTKNSSNLVSNDLTLAASQKLKVEPVSGGVIKNGTYVKISASDGKVVDLSGARADSGRNVQFYTWNGSNAQIWRVAINSDGTIALKSKVNENYVLDISGASQNYGANVQLYQNNGSRAQKWHLASMQITSAQISASDHNTVTVKASGDIQQSDDGKAYLFATEPYVSMIGGKSPVTSAALSSGITFTTALNKNTSASLLQKKLYVAVKQDGVYRIISNAFYITNPEAAAANTTAFPTSKRGTKKGLKLGRNQYAQAESLKCSHAIIDMPIEDFFRSGGDRMTYNYEGKNYTFYNVGNYIYQLKEFKSRGILVTGIFYLSDKSLTNLMEPEARSSLNTTQYNRVPVIMGINTKDANRKTLEALYACLAESFTKDGYPLVANWLMGNEVDQFIQYNYSGNIGYNLYHEALAEQYRLFNASIKSRWSNARCYISLDHNWNVSWDVPGTYQGMGLVSNFNTDLARQGGVHWDMAMHPYPSPEQDCRFWNRVNTVTDSGSCGQVTMQNARAWAAALKKTYGNGVHINMSETGLSSRYNGTNLLNEQAAAVAYGYYLAEFDSNIDVFGIHRITDEAGEMNGGWYLGIMGKPAENVFRYMDTKNWKQYTNKYVSYVKKSNGASASSWADVVSGFNGSRWNNLS